MPRIMAPPPSGTNFSVALEQPFDAQIATKRIEIFAEPNREGEIKVTERSGDQLQNILQHTGTLDKQDSSELYDLLKELRGYPSNPDKDIYGINTRLAFTHDLQWSNDGDESTGDVTNEIKEGFKSTVQKIEALARQKAKQPARV